MGISELGEVRNIPGVDELKKEMEKKNYSQTWVAKRLGVSTTTLTLMLKGSYKGNYKNIEKRIKDFLGRERLRAKSLKESFISTSISKEIFEVCKTAQADKDIEVIIGKSGTGKTISLNEYAKRNTEVVYLEVDCTYTQTVLLDELLESLGAVVKRGRIHDKQKKIIKILKGSDKLIIIDQAEFLKKQSMEILRTIYDKADIGVVLCGLYELENFLLQMPEYINTRIGIRQILKGLTKADIGAIARNLKSDIGEEVIELLYKEGRGNGRGIVKSLKRAYKVALYRGEKIGVKIVKKMMEMLRAA